MSTRSDLLRAKAREIQPLLEKASAIAKRADGQNRAMTTDERQTYDGAMSQAEPVLAALKAARNDESVWADVRRLEADLGGKPGAKGGQRLSFKNMAGGIANRMMTGDMGRKALAPSGAAVLSQGFVEDPIALGRAATGLTDILPVTVQSSPEYAYLRQTTRTNNASVVDEGDTKPTSVLGLTRVEASLAVVAHLSEGIPRYWLADNGAIEQFVNAELEFGLRKAVEAKVIADVNATSGIQTQAWSVSIAQTLRKSLTKIEVAGYTPGAIVLHPSDFEILELALSSTNAVEHIGLPYDAAQRRLFGVPIATTVSATAGVGHVIAADAVVVDTDAQGVQIQWSESSNATDWETNTIRSRVEMRSGTSCLSPLGAVVADLTA